MDIHEEIEALVSDTETNVKTEQETITPEKFEEIRQFLSGTRNCTVGGIVYNDEGEILLVRHANESGWIQPGGMVEQGELLDVALEREVREETGVSVAVEEPFFVRRREFASEERTIPWYTVQFLAEATATSIGDDLGVEGEEIVDCQWFEQLPEQLHDLLSGDLFQEALSEIERRV